MKQFHLEVKENEELARGRKVFDQTIYVSALERGTRDRSPRRVGPLPDRIEFKICPQKNHRGRMNYYRARSIPELCRITLTPTGETSQQQGRMEEVYITQYTHSFDREIEKPHVVAWKRAFEDSDVAHRDSKLCIVNSPVGSKNEGYPERRKSAPPGSFVFNYDTLDVPEPVLRRSKSLGTNMNDLVDFDNMDTQVGANASGNIDLEMGESAGGKMPVRPLAHETISAQKQEQVESVDLSFWEDDAFKRFDDGETSNNTTNGVRNGHVTAGDTVVDNVAADSATTSYVRNGDVRSGDVTTSYVRYDDVRGGHITTSYVRSGDVRSDDLSNGLNVPCDEITHDSREHNNMQDPTKQALSLISTLRSTVKKPDSQMFLRSVHATQTSSESTGKNHVPRKNQSKDPTPQKLPEQGVLYRSTVQPRTSSTREYPQKVTPRIISNPRKECTYQTVRQHEVLPREPVLPEKKSRKKLPAEIMPGKVVAREDLPRKDTQVETELNSDPMRNHPKDKAQVNHEYGLVKKKYISKYEPTTTVPNHSTSKPNNSYPRSDEKEKPSKRKVDQDGVKTSHFSRPKKQTSSELQDTSYDSYENVHVKSVASTKVSDKNHPSLGSSEFRFESATTNQKEDYYQEPKLILNTMEGSETHYSILPKYFENHQPKSAINVTAEHMTPDQNGDHYQEPKPILNTVERSEADYNTPQQHGENHQPRSAMNITPEQVTPKQNEKYYQEPDREVRRNKTVKTNDYNHLTRSQSTEGPASEQVSKQHYEEYHQEPNFEEKTLSGYSKQDGNTVLNINSTSSVLPGEEGSQTLNEDYYQNVDKRTREMVVTNYSVHSKQDGCTVKDHKNTSNVSSEQVERNEDHYQIPNSLVMKLKPSETSPGSHVKQARHTTYRTTIEGTTCSQEEDYYQHTNSDVNTSKTVEVDQSFHLKQERDYNKNGKPTLEQGENYYQQPNPSARKMEAQNQPQRYDEDARYHYDSQIAGGTSESRTPDEHYYQQPRFDSKTFPAPTILTKLQTNTNVYEEPKHSTTSLQKCPLDQSDRQRNDNDYNKSLPEVPTERKTSETYYETPKDAHPSSMKCPIDDTDAERSVTGDYFGQTVEHIYEQPNFETERVYEQFDYEKMNAPQSKLPSSSFKKVSDSEKDEMYEQPDKMVYVNVEDKTDRKHLDSRMRCKVVKTEHLEDTPGEVCHKPSMKQENTKRSGALVPETLHTIQADKQNNNTSSTVSTAKTPHHSDAVNPNHKQTDYQQSSITSLRSMNDLKKDLKSADQSTRVKYGGEINTKKSMVSSTSSLPPNQSDDRISNNSPNSQSAYSEGEVLPQKPEAEVSKERTRVKPKAVNGEKPQYDEISPSTYSKDNSGNTSLARFSSFNSEASYKRRLTSAWIEQQRINFRKNVSREPSLRRTKSVELHKERAASEDTADYKLKHSKSELSFEHLDAMYEPFDDKHFDTNPNKHPVKVVHAAPSEVFTKAKSLERRVEKAEEPEYFSQENISSNTESLTRSRGENAKDENPESRRIFVEGIISRQDGMATNSEVNPWREPNKKSKVRPKSADVSEFDRRTFNDQTERLWIGERSLRDAEFSQRSKPRPNSTDVSGFDVTRFSNGGTNLPMRENNRGLENNKSKPSSVQRSRVRPKSADVTTFDITSYNERQQIVSMEEKDERLAKNQSKTGSVQKSKVRPKSADVSGFDVATYNGDEPTLKHSKSEVSVNQLKAMYDPYDQNSWFSPDPASQHVNQSNTVQVEATVHDVVHRRTRSEPESRPDSSKTGRKMDQIEPKTSKGEIRSLESEPVKNITKLDSSSVLLLNVVEVEQSGQPKNSNFIRNVSGKSNSNIVSVRASEIENKKHLTMSETKVRESTRNTKQNNSDNATKSSTDQIIQNEKPIEKHRARYITGGERASVRYLSKSTDELTSNDNETMKEILPEPQGEQKPSKAPKKDGRFLNFFGRLRKSKSEPNLDKNFDILDIDSDHGGKKENSQTFKEPEKNFSETPHENSKGKSPNSSRSLKNSFYPKLKNLAKNLAKSKQSKTDSSFNDSGVDSGKDISTNQEFAETSVISESKVERENVEITESQVVRSQNVASRKIDSSISSQSVDSTKSSQYHANKHETPQLFVQIEQQSVQKDKETEPISPSSPVTSPKSAKKRFFQGGNRVKPVTVTVKDSDNNPGKTQGKTTSNSVVTSQGSQKSIANEESLEKRNRIISTSLPPTPIDNHQDRITETPVSRSVDDTALNSRPVFEADSKLPEDQMQLHSTSNESMHREAKERTTSYRITEITGKRGSVSDGNNSRFIGSSTRREHLKSIDQSASDSVVTYKNNTDKICEITLQGDDSKNPDINSKREESKAKQSKESEIAKTKHRSFFKTKISTSAGKASSSQGRDSPERKGKKEDRKEYEGTRETEGRSSEDPGQDSTVIKDDTLDNSNPVLKEESTLSSSKEIAKSREALKEEKKVKKQSLKDKEDKEKSEFGTKIKGFITKVLPQKDAKKSSSKENSVNETPGKTTVAESGSPDENNNPTTSSNDDNQQPNTSFITKSRRSIFVAKHLGESDTEKTRTSEEEGGEVRVETKKLTTSHPDKSERRYASKAKHLGDHKTIKTKSFESEKHTGQRFLTVEADDIVRENLRGSGVGSTNGKRSFPKRDAFEPKRLQNESITKTEVVDNVEAFDSVFDFFENEFNDEESKDGKEESLPKPDAQKHSKEFKKASSGLVVSNNTLEHGRNFRVSNEKENRAKRDDNQLARGDRINGLKGSGGHISTTHVNVNTTDAKCQEISPNVHTKGDIPEETTADEKQRNLEQIKGFTIKHTKTSSLVLNKSIEDDLDKLGEDSDENPQGNLKHRELNTYQVESPRNVKTHITTSGNKADHGRSIEIDNNETTPKTTASSSAGFLTKDEEDTDQHLKYVEKVMVLVHRGASDVKRLVQESNAQSSDVHSTPASTPLLHSRQSSGESYDGQSSRMDLTREMSGAEKKVVRPVEKSLQNDITSDESSFSGRRPSEHNRTGSRDDDSRSKVILTREMPAENAMITRLSPERNFRSVITNQDKKRVLKMNGDWGDVVEEFLITNKTETTSSDVKKRHGDELFEFIEEQLVLEKTSEQLQPEDSSTPIQDENMKNRGKSGHHDFTNSSFSSTSRTTSKSLEMVDKTDGGRLGTRADVEETKEFSTSRNATTSSRLHITTAPAANSTSTNLVKTSEMTTSLPPSNAATVSRTKIRTRPLSANFEEQRTESITRTATLLQQQNETVASQKLTRPKSFLNKNTKKNSVIVSMSDGDNRLKETADSNGVSSSTKNTQRNSKNEVLNTNVELKEKAKREPPPVLPKPQRNKGKEISQVKTEDARHEDQRKPLGFIDVQNNNLSLVNFQSFQGNYKENAGRSGPRFQSLQSFETRENFTSSKGINSERKEKYEGVASLKQFKNQRMTKSDAAFNEYKNGDSTSETLGQVENNKATTSNGRKQRRQGGTTVSDTSEDLAIRLQRLLCEDESMSQRDDSSATHEVASTVYSFSEDSEFDRNLMELRYKSPLRSRKSPATLKNPRSSHIPLDDSSDDEVLENNTKLNYAIHSKTL